MKIVHLNTYDGNGGAGRAVLRLDKGLKHLGLDSKVLCLYKFNSSTKVEAISKTFFGKLKAVVSIMGERFLIKKYLKNKSVPFSLQYFGLSVTDLEVIRQADVLHIHWINHGFLAPEQLEELATLNKTIVWTTHDSNPFTGGCHVRYGCEHFLNECGNCPVLSNPGPDDLSHRNWLAKKAGYSKLSFNFISPSEWMAARAQESSLNAGRKVYAISNALETDVFRPLNKALCRKELEIDEDAVVVLAGYMPSVSDRHKGFPELIETLNYLAVHPDIDRNKLLLIFYGSDGKGADFTIPVNHRFMGKISSDDTLVKLYNVANVFLFTSLEESMGYTALESISCGTPVAAFNTSGVTDVVVHQLNGYLAELKNTQALADGLVWILTEGQKRNLPEFGRQWAENNFSLEVVAQKHYALYTELMNDVRL